jgi:hypothetical protein
LRIRLTKFLASAEADCGNQKASQTEARKIARSEAGIHSLYILAVEAERKRFG